MNLRRALVMMAACYPLMPVGLMAGMACCAPSVNPIAYVVLLGYYVLLLLALRYCFHYGGAARSWFGLALLVSLAHAVLAFVCVAGPNTGRDALLGPLLLGIVPVSILVCLGGCHLAYGFGHPRLAKALAIVSLGCFPLAWMWGFSLALFGYMAQALLLLWLACVPCKPPEPEAGEIGFTRAPEELAGA